VIWRAYWAGAVVLTAVAVGLAIASGNGENLIVAAILPPGLLMIVAGMMAATISSIRGEPSSPDPCTGKAMSWSAIAAFSRR
jgi:uncharacterized protein (DUF58 family)